MKGILTSKRGHGDNIASTALIQHTVFVSMTEFVRVIVCTPSADQLRPKGGKTMVACAAAEHSNNLQKGGPGAERSVG